MGYSTLFYITALFFLAFSCGSSEETNGANVPADTLQKEVVTKDTTVSNHTVVTKDTAPEMPPPPDPGPAPGTATVKGKVLAIHQNEDHTGGILKFKVLQVLKYGSSTPIIVTEDTLTLEMTIPSDSLTVGMQYKMGLKHQQRLILGNEKNDKTSNWRLIDIEPVKKK